MFLGIEFWEAKSPGVTTSDCSHPRTWDPCQSPHWSLALGPGQGHLCRGAAASELGVRGGGRGEARPWQWPPGQWGWYCPCLTAAWPGPLGHTPSFALKVVLSLGGTQLGSKVSERPPALRQVLPLQWRGSFHHLWSHGCHEHQELRDGGRGLGIVSTSTEGLRVALDEAPVALATGAQLQPAPPLITDTHSRQTAAAWKCAALLRPGRVGVLGCPACPRCP